MAGLLAELVFCRCAGVAYALSCYSNTFCFRPSPTQMPCAPSLSSKELRERFTKHESLLRTPPIAQREKHHPKRPHKPRRKLTDICLNTPQRRDPRYTDECIQAEKLALEQSLAPSTTESYVNAVEKFIAWARALGFQDQEIQPASEDLICFYIAQFVGRFGESHARTHLNAIRQWHLQHGHTWESSLRVETIINGIKKAKPASSIRSNRPPVTLDMMKTLRKGLNLRFPEDACCWAIACIAFWGACRLGELVTKRTTEADNRTHPRVADIVHISDDCSSIFLPYTKTHQNRGEITHIFRQEDELDPIMALKRHISLSRLSPNHLIATFLRPNGSMIQMSKDRFMELCNKVWMSKGGSRVTGHSFRIGGATVFLEYGVESDIVKRLGRWKSDAALLYWRNLPRVLGQRAICITTRSIALEPGHHDGACGRQSEEEQTGNIPRIICRIPKEKITKLRTKRSGAH